MYQSHVHEEMNSVLCNVDLVATILAFADGDPSKRIVVRDTVPRVCKTWNMSWNVTRLRLIRHIPSAIPCTHSIYLSVAETEQRMRQWAHFCDDYHRAMEPYRSEYTKRLRHMKIPPIIARIVVNNALSLQIPRDDTTPLCLRMFIAAVRMHTASTIIEQCTVPLLPIWYAVSKKDPLHMTLNPLRPFQPTSPPVAASCTRKTLQ